MTVTLEFTPLCWALIPSKFGSGWGRYLKLRFLIFTLYMIGIN